MTKCKLWFGKQTPINQRYMPDDLGHNIWGGDSRSGDLVLIFERSGTNLSQSKIGEFK